VSVSTFCTDCGVKKRNTLYTGSFQCEPCRNELIERINNNCREIDVTKESRIDFLVRRTKELGISKPVKEIKYMMSSGYEDWQILNDKPLHVWTWGNGNSLKAPYYYD